jgi:hypothetical protein
MQCGYLQGITVPSEYGKKLPQNRNNKLDFFVHGFVMLMQTLMMSTYRFYIYIYIHFHLRNCIRLFITYKLLLKIMYYYLIFVYRKLSAYLQRQTKVFLRLMQSLNMAYTVKKLKFGMAY